jgi:hypothetical protein
MLLTIITPFEAKVKEMEEAPGKENGGRVRVSRESVQYYTGRNYRQAKRSSPIVHFKLVINSTSESL